MSNYIEATLPLSPENQVKYFKDKSIRFNIDIENSPINSKQCLMTLSNMQLNVQIKEVSQETLYEYMVSKFLVRTTNLDKIFANVLFAYKHQTLCFQDVESFFSIDDYAVFVEKHQDVLAKWCEVIEAIPMYLLFCSRGFAEEQIDSLRKEIPTVEGALDGVGVNLSQIVALPEFLTLFLEPQNIKDTLASSYYTYYFDEYIYSGKKLLRFLASEDHKSDFAIDAISLVECFKENEVKILEGEQS